MGMEEFKSHIGDIGIGIDGQKPIMIGTGILFMVSDIFGELFRECQGSYPVIAFFPYSEVFIDQGRYGKGIIDQLITVPPCVGEWCFYRGGIGAYARNRTGLEKIIDEWQCGKYHRELRGLKM